MSAQAHSPSDFAPLAEFAEAGLRATTLALDRAQRSFDEGRIPIAAAAVYRDPTGEIEPVAVGHNGRIPLPDSGDAGYPTDHGETAAIRAVGDVRAWDWSRIVFATSLSPCIMCNRALTALHAIGLNKLVIAEARTFAGTAELLRRLPGMTLVELEDARGVRRMRDFARTYPWDWAADIGEVPPGDTRFSRGLREHPADVRRLCGELASRPLGDAGAARAGIVDPGGTLVSAALDERSRTGGNPALSAPMIALGRAGSALDLRASVLVFCADDARRPVRIEDFGHASLGACELFRPAAVASDATFDAGLRGALERAGVPVLAPG